MATIKDTEKTPKAKAPKVTKSILGTTGGVINTTAAPVQEKKKAGRPKKEAAPAIEMTPIDFRVETLPMDRIEVNYKLNPRFNGSEDIATYEQDTQMLRDMITAAGQLVPVAGYFPNNDETKDLVLVEGFRRVTSMRLLNEAGKDYPNKGKVLVQILPDPKKGSLLGRQLAVNITQKPYTLAETLRIYSIMSKTTDKNGKVLSDTDIAREFKMTPQAFHKMATIAKDGEWIGSVERGDLAVDTAYQAIQAKKDALARLKAEQDAVTAKAAAKGETADTKTEEELADQAAAGVRATIEALQEKNNGHVTAAMVKAERATIVGNDTPAPAPKANTATKVVKVGEKVTPDFLAELAKLTDAVNALCNSRDMVPSDILRDLMQVVLDGTDANNPVDMADSFEQVVAVHLS